MQHYKIWQIGLPAVRRTQPTTKKAKISSTTHVQMLQWLHGKQQQHERLSGLQPKNDQL